MSGRINWIEGPEIVDVSPPGGPDTPWGAPGREELSWPKASFRPGLTGSSTDGHQGVHTLPFLTGSLRGLRRSLGALRATRCDPAGRGCWPGR